MCHRREVAALATESLRAVAVRGSGPVLVLGVGPAAPCSHLVACGAALAGQPGSSRPSARPRVNIDARGRAALEAEALAPRSTPLPGFCSVAARRDEKLPS